MRTHRIANAPVTLHVSRVEKGRTHEGVVVTALHGVNKGRPWRLSMADAVLASKSGRYLFSVENDGERRKLTICPGTTRLEAVSRTQGDLLLQLPVVDDVMAA